MLLNELPSAELRRRLRADGLRLRTGPVAFSIHSPVPEVAAGLPGLYGAYPVLDSSDFVDFHVGIQYPNNPRGWLRRQVIFTVDGTDPFAPLPGDQGIPMLEWSLNWCVSTQCHQWLILHSAVLERQGRALLLPAPSGSGKSTLCAALTFRGWRLLSDELALLEPATGRVVPMPRPVSLKNASIDVIRRFSEGQAQFASIVRDTVKGTVGHFPADARAMAGVGQAVPVGWIVTPRYAAGAPVTWERTSRGHTLMTLNENAFNANAHGRRGFELLCDVVEGASGWAFRYGQLEEAMTAFDALVAGETERAHPEPTLTALDAGEAAMAAATAQPDPLPA